MKILITGGAGFIGSAVVRYIIEHTQDRVINLDKLTYAGNLENLASVSHSPRYHFVQADICNREKIDQILAEHQPDAIMHLAAESHVDRSIDGPAAFIETNIIGTYHLLEAARSYWNALPASKQQQFRFHHISTDEVYGDLPHPNDGQTETGNNIPLPLFTETTAYAIDSSKMQNQLGWTPEETFESGMRKIVEWYLNNQQWWQRVLNGEYQLARLGDVVSLRLCVANRRYLKDDQKNHGSTYTCSILLKNFSAC